MIGRAGRNGCPARAHILCTTRKTKDPLLTALTANEKENCRRRSIMRGLGSSEDTSRNDACCDNCGEGILSRLNFLKNVPARRNKKRKPVRTVDQAIEQKLKVALLEEREKILMEEPGYRMLGVEFVLSTS